MKMGQKYGLWEKKDANYCMYNGTEVSCSSDAIFQELKPYEWKVKFSHGDLFGTSGCSSTGGTAAQPGDPNVGAGEYCWCKATGYRAINTSVISKPSAALSYVLHNEHTSANLCTRLCANRCASYIESSSEFREPVFGIDQ